MAAPCLVYAEGPSLHRGHHERDIVRIIEARAPRDRPALAIAPATARTPARLRLRVPTVSAAAAAGRPVDVFTRRGRGSGRAAREEEAASCRGEVRPERSRTAAEGEQGSGEEQGGREPRSASLIHRQNILCIVTSDEWFARACVRSACRPQKTRSGARTHCRLRGRMSVRGWVRTIPDEERRPGTPERRCPQESTNTQLRIEGKGRNEVFRKRRFGGSLWRVTAVPGVCESLSKLTG